MLSVVLLFVIGRYFYQLAFEYNKNQWVYAVIGGLVFFASQFLIGIIAAVLYNLILEKQMNSGIQIMIGLLGTLLAGLVTFLFYRQLEKNWSNKKNMVMEDDVLDQQL